MIAARRSGSPHRHEASYTPENRDVVTPNNDTPYSWAWLDLRAEPWVVSVPAVANRRYYVQQWVDLFTYNFAYIGSRATGNEAGDFLIAGPNWKGQAPAGIKQVDLMKRFATIGIGPGKPFDATKVPAATLAAIDDGVKDAQAVLAEKAKVTLSSNGLFGSRADLQNDYMTRAIAADKGLYGNSLVEAWYGGYVGDGNQLSTIHFAPWQLPPARFFWSMTLYTLPDRFLYPNPLKRYSIGDRTKGLKRDADGGPVGRVLQALVGALSTKGRNPQVAICELWASFGCASAAVSAVFPYIRWVMHQSAGCPIVRPRLEWFSTSGNFVTNSEPRWRAGYACWGNGVDRGTRADSADRR